MTVSERLRTIGKHLRHDLKRQVKQGMIPAQRYTVQTSDTYERRIDVYSDRDLDDPDRSMLEKICRAHLDPEYTFQIWVNGARVA